MNLNELMQHLVGRRPAWCPGDADILLMGRMAVAVNLAERPFPARMTPEQRTELLRTLLADEALCGNLAHRIPPDRPGVQELEFLAERWILEPAQHRGTEELLLLAADESRGLLLLGHDHLRYTALGQAAELRSALDDLEARLENLRRDPGLARSSQGERLGSSPFLCGSGTLVTLVLHLPGLAWWGKLEEQLDPLYDEGLSYRTWQEGFGDFLVLENIDTRAETDPRQTLERLLAALDRLRLVEQQCRRDILQHRAPELEDRVRRAWSLCREARLMGYPEFVEHASFLRLGRLMGLQDEAHPLPELLHDVTPLLLDLSPAQVRLRLGQELDGRQLAAGRAELLRQHLNQGASR